MYLEEEQKDDDDDDLKEGAPGGVGQEASRDPSHDLLPLRLHIHANVQGDSHFAEKVIGVNGHNQSDF